MTARQFTTQLRKLGWSLSDTARELGVPAGKPRISEWKNGQREIPPYIAAHMATLKELCACRELEPDRLAKDAERKRDERARGKKLRALR